MVGGPVFEFELLTTARRGRYYVVRVAYALVLLLILWNMHLGWVSGYGENLTHSQVRVFAHVTFAALAIAQEMPFWRSRPALVAGVIASEKQSKTLHYVLASPLTSFDLVLGKLLARMLHVGHPARGLTPHPEHAHSSRWGRAAAWSCSAAPRPPRPRSSWPRWRYSCRSTPGR